MADYTRVFRLLKVLNLVRSGPGWTAKRLAEECGVAERSIYRDLEALGKIGIHLRFDDASDGYVIESQIFLPPLHLAADEALSLALLCENIAAGQHISFLSPAERALSKIRAELPTELQSEVDELLQTVTMQMGPSTPAEGFEDIYENIRRAIAERRALVCKYESSRSTASSDEPFEFEPYALFFSVRAWYAVGFHAARGEVRTLKLNRFLQAKLAQRTYDIPADFTIDAHLGNAWRMIRGDRDWDVEIWFSPGFAETMADTQWHKTQDVEEHEDGSATFRVTVSGLHEIKWWVLSMGANCRVVKPRELAELVAEEAARVVDLYQHA